MKMAYCDLIAHIIKRALKNALEYNDGLYLEVQLTYDLHPTKGYYMSSKKFINVTDHNDKKYKVTIEELPLMTNDDGSPHEENWDS